MQGAIVAPCTPASSHRAPIGGVKFFPLHRPSCALRLKSSKQGLGAQWKTQLISSNTSNGRPKIVCLFDGIGKVFGENAKDAAKKAFDTVLEGKEKAFSKWKDVSQKRDRDMGRDDEGRMGGGGRYSGGGGSGNPGDEDDWLDTFLASSIFLWMYMKMRGVRWTRTVKFKSYPYDDFYVLWLWTTGLFRWFLNTPFVLFLEINFLWAKCYLHRLRTRARKVASSTSTD